MAVIKPIIPHIVTIYDDMGASFAESFSERYIAVDRIDLSRLNSAKDYLLFVGGQKAKAASEMPAIQPFKTFYAKDETALSGFYLGVVNIVNRLRYQKEELRAALQKDFLFPDSDFPNLGSWAETQHQMLAYYLRQTGNRLTTAQSSGRKYAHIAPREPEKEDAALNAWSQSQIQTIRSLHQQAFKG